MGPKLLCSNAAWFHHKAIMHVSCTSFLWQSVRTIHFGLMYMCDPGLMSMCDPAPQVTRGQSYNIPFASGSSFDVCITLRKGSTCSTLKDLVPEQIQQDGKFLLPYAYTTMNTAKQCCGNEYVAL